MNDDQLKTAEAFLQEAVYQSRGAQAAAASLKRADGEATGVGNCGLGEKAAVVLALSERGQELFEQLWSAEPSAADYEEIRATMRGWIKHQDELDRKRNHFMKAFRKAHGFDRSEYAPEVLAEYDSGIDAINAEANTERRRAAETLVSN